MAFPPPPPLYEQGLSQLHFVMNPANYVVSPGHIYIYVYIHTHTHINYVYNILSYIIIIIIGNYFTNVLRDKKRKSKIL